MSLESGSTLGQYEVLSSLGAGGMGEVYRVRDSKLGREVAVKLLLEDVSETPDRLARFEREARVLASLNHPNIATLYGFESVEGTHFLVMELVEGETLADRIARGPIPPDQAIPLFLKIAEGLEAAHAKGIIHRDLKPANIKVSEEGVVKILDFGLAKTVEPEQGAGHLSQSPTLTAGATQHGMLLGTAAYMSPEQARGMTVDKRTDVWAFGVVLWEALTGGCLFSGESVSDVLAAVLRENPDLRRLPPLVPPSLRRLLRRCLAKDASKRLAEMSSLRLELEDAEEELSVSLSDGDGSPETGKTRASGRSRRFLLAAFALLAVAAIGLTFFARWTTGSPEESAKGIRRLSMNLPPEWPLSDIHVERMGIPTMQLSADGRWLVYVTPANEIAGEGLLVKRRLEESGFELVSNKLASMAPIISPDSQWVAFFSRYENTIFKVRLQGGEPIALGSPPIGGAQPVTGACWGADGWIYLGVLERGLYRLPEGGGELERIRAIEPGEGNEPQVSCLPGAGALLFTTVGNEYADLRTHLLDFATGDSRVLLEGAARPKYTSDGYLVYVHPGALMAVAFDSKRLTTSGTPHSVTAPLMSKTPFPLHWSISNEGTLIYAAASPIVGSTQPVLISRSGEQRDLGLPPLPAMDWASASPDGRRVAAPFFDELGRLDIQIVDAEPGGSTDRLTLAKAYDMTPIWTPDGSQIVYSSTRSGTQNLYLQSVDRSQDPVRLTENAAAQYPSAISPDGGTLLFAQRNQETLVDLYQLDLSNPEHPVSPVFEGPAMEDAASFSPDGRWIAYLVNDLQRVQILVRSWPGLGTEHLIEEAESGAIYRSVWGPRGDEIFFIHRGKGVMAVGVRTSPTFAADDPRVLIPGSFAVNTLSVGPEAQQFLVAKIIRGEPITELHVVENWFEELNRLVPTN